MKTVRRFLLILFLFSLVSGAAVLYVRSIVRNLPVELYIYNNKDTVVELDIPVTAVIKETGQTVDFSRSVTFSAKSSAQYSLEYKLFNLISLPSGKLSVLEDNYLYAGGFPVGMYIKTEGVLVIDVAEFTGADSQTVSPVRDVLCSGDYIVSIDGEEILKKKQIAEILNKSDGSSLDIGYVCDGEVKNASVTPVADENGDYKLGIWVKDDDQGIGTVTYIDRNGNYGALGHGMSDSVTGEVTNVSNGFLYNTEIVSITRGSTDSPGEYVGIIDYSSANRIGLISENTDCGVFGTIPTSKCDELIELYNLEAYEIGFRREVHKGSAQILVWINGELGSYDIEIEEIANRTQKAITFKVTSDELIAKTGGIVRGCSGSPIIQNGKIIGAVTHVFVNDPTKGYGIFIEDMLEVTQVN